jgi:protease-4
MKQGGGFADKRGLITVVAIFGSLFVMLLLFAVVMLSAFGGSGFGSGPNQVGVVEIKGPIMESKKTVADLRAFARDENIKAIVVRIDSPGGAVAPSQEIFQAVKRAAEKKPLVASMGSTAASGGYYIALGAPHIVANPGTVTGSIGVISQIFNVEGLLDTLEVDVHTIKTGKFKDSGSPFREFTAADRKYFDALISDIYEQFIEDVAAARDMELDAVRELADGRVFSGRQAKELKLVDALGSMQDAVNWVKEEAEIEGEATLVYPPEEKMGLMSTLIKGATQTAVREIRSQQTPVIEFRMP